MARRSIGPRLRILKKRGAYYIVWTEDGTTRERSTGTTDSAKAQIELAQFLQQPDVEYLCTGLDANESIEIFLYYKYLIWVLRAAVGTQHCTGRALR